MMSLQHLDRRARDFFGLNDGGRLAPHQSPSVLVFTRDAGSVPADTRVRLRYGLYFRGSAYLNLRSGPEWSIHSVRRVRILTAVPRPFSDSG